MKLDLERKVRGLRVVEVGEIEVIIGVREVGLMGKEDVVEGRGVWMNGVDRVDVDVESWGS